MTKIFPLTASLLLIVAALSAQTKVANYAIGKYGTDKYEHFEFWTKDGKKQTSVTLMERMTKTSICNMPAKM